MSNHYCEICDNACRKYKVIDGVRTAHEYCCVCRELYNSDIVGKYCVNCNKRLNSALQRIDDIFAYRELVALQDDMDALKKKNVWRLIG